MSYYEKAMRPKASKTVIVLDRSSKFNDLSNEQFDLNIKEGSKIKTVASCKKTIWSWCLEGIFEMHRIISDTFPLGEPLIRFAVSDVPSSGNSSRLLDSEWGEKLSTRKEMLELLKNVRGASKNEDEKNVSPISGLMLAIDAIGQNLKEKQDTEIENFKKIEPDSAGNIIIFTRYTQQDDVEKLQSEVAKLLEARNKISLTLPTPAKQISKIRLFIVNFYALGEECNVKTKPLLKFSEGSVLETWVISRSAGFMAEAIHSMIISAFRLISTTITKIPMKEENRSSAIYDVELFHVKPVHSILKRLGVICDKNTKGFATEGVTYETTRLAWATVSKIKWSLFGNHRTVVPCTSVQAYTRQSACLTQFLMDGRSVLLDLERTGKVAKYPNNVGKFLISHMLKVNNGRIFIHEIDFIPKKHPRNIDRLLPCEPSASVDRLNTLQYKHIFQQMRLKKVEINHLKSNSKTYDPFNMKQPRLKLQKLTRNVPLHLEDTFVFQPHVIKNFEPLLTIITKDELSDVDIENCRANILKLYEKRENGTHLVLPSVELKANAIKNLADCSEQMRVAFVELSKYLANYRDFSEKHIEVHEIFKKTLGIDLLIKDDSPDSDTELDQSVARMFNSSSSSSHAKSTDKNDKETFLKKLRTFSKEDGEISDEKEDEPMKKKLKKKEEHVQYSAKDLNINLLSIFCDKYEKHVAKTRREFVGRELYGEKAKLYVNLDSLAENGAEKTATPPPSAQQRFKN
ncbi:unnamed protein product [Caenorhabditis angaria]|uniref:Protein asunder n=1 Tax=Caenorhabditis angaria TaxID=860376 RepID=A0A9P1INU0_9PELO|nr:unnamed protein product [Caenorhabditis angaria]